MVGNVKYEELESFIKELEASNEAIKKLIEGKDAGELTGFIQAVDNYKEYLDKTLSINKDADEAINILK